MSASRADVIVLGAGIVGVSAALHLQRRGRSVVLVDRRAPGEETSHGNLGLIERSTIFPPAFPRRLDQILRYLGNHAPEARYEPSFLPRILPWLVRYWWHSAPHRQQRAMAGLLPLIERSVIEHDTLSSGTRAAALYRKEGWLKAYRTARGLEAASKEIERLRAFGIRNELLDAAALRQREPGLAAAFAGAVHMHDPWTATDPGGVTKALAESFAARGGSVLRGDARTLAEAGQEWAVATGNGRIVAREVIIALGPWSDVLCRRLGYAIPMAVKRGYHMNYQIDGDTRLFRPVADVEHGYALAPIAQGIRLTTGIEFADRNALPTPIQLRRSEPVARSIFALGRPLHNTPWMGCRPCMADMLPVIGAAPRHSGLWLSFGHGHLGFTLGPVTGRLLAEIVNDEEPFTDPSPYRADRFMAVT